MTSKQQIIEVEQLALRMRKTALKMAYECGVAAHIGGGLSIIDILATLYGHAISDPGKIDKFILSKGHGVLGLYSALYEVGILTKQQISTFQTDGSYLIAHPIMDEANGIESSNGSLGQGLSMAIGIALSFKKRKLKNQVFVIVGDGECYEGSIWEAAITAAEQSLCNLTVIVDCNGYQNDGSVSNEMTNEKLAGKWAAFGWHVSKCDGHDVVDIIEALKFSTSDKPKAIIAKTIKGFGVSFMENNNDWHHNRLSEKLYNQAIQEIEKNS